MSMMLTHAWRTWLLDLEIYYLQLADSNYKLKVSNLDTIDIMQWEIDRQLELVSISFFYSFLKYL